MEIPFEYVLPVIRGIQAGREYYVSMCPVRLIPKLFPFDDEEIQSEMRAQRTMNRSRVPEIARYVLDNPTNYIFGAITASINANITFEAIGSEAETRNIGRLRVPVTFSPTNLAVWWGLLHLTVRACCFFGSYPTPDKSKCPAQVPSAACNDESHRRLYKYSKTQVCTTNT